MLLKKKAPCSVTRGFVHFHKYQQHEQADMSRNFSIFSTFFISKDQCNYDSITSYQKHCGLVHPKKPAFTLFQTSSGFHVSAEHLLKTLREKEKLLVTSNFSFSPCVFYSFEELSAIFIKLCHLQTLSIRKSLKFVVWERVKPLFYKSRHIYISNSS